MCLGVYADQPLAVDLLIESIQPVMATGTHIAASIHLTQSFDLLIRNCGDAPIKRLVGLHSRNFLPQQALGKTLTAWNTNWVGNALYGRSNDDEPVAFPTGLWRLPVQRFPYPGCPQATTHVIARRITPKTVSPHPAITPQNKELFSDDWPTILDIELPEDLREYDPADAQNTTYLLCLAFSLRDVKPEAEQRVEIPLPAHPHSPLRKTLKTLSTLDPQTGWDKFANKLDRAANAGGPLAPEAQTLRDQFIINGARRPQHTTRWRDVRLFVVTDHRCGLHDHHETGAVGLWQIRNLRGTQAPGTLPRYAHVWVAGDDYYPQYDAVAIAQRILASTVVRYDNGERYFRLDDFWGPISGELANNVQTVIDALTQLGYFQYGADKTVWQPVPAQLPDRAGMTPEEQVALERGIMREVAARRALDPSAFHVQGHRVLYTLENYDLRP